MIQGVAFQTRARTIDHLGRGQIADAPTAVSELWKNAYDAYAKNVALHIFDGSPEVAAIFDDGIGMSRKDVLERWLVIGTESKFEDAEKTPVETLGLPVRPRQGEKGIGRLSVAFLAPGTVLITKRANSEFVVVIVDWRLFENPFLALEDIQLPVQIFPTADALADGLPTLLDTLKSNFGGKSTDRDKRLTESWKRFSEYEKKNHLSSTVDSIGSSWAKMPLTRRHLEEWPVFLGLADHGTAIFMVGLNNELGVWVRPTETGEEVDEVKERLRQTLTAFTDSVHTRL
jgi:Histidine kinase-, DNA gyrase B-, and HSP90-like ATPase